MLRAYGLDEDLVLPITLTAYDPLDSVRNSSSGVLPPWSLVATRVEQPRYSSTRAPTARSPSTMRTWRDDAT